MRWIHQTFTFYFVYLFTTFTEAPAQSLEKQYTSVPIDAVEYLEKLPNKKLTLRLILRRGMATSDSFKIIQSRLVEKEAPVLEARSSLATIVEISGTTVDNRNEPSSAFSASSSTSNTLEVSASKKFATGTSLSTSLTHGDSNTDFVSFTDSKFVQSELNLSLSQSLWQDRFGRSTQKKLEAGDTLADSVQAEVHEQSVNWMKDLTDLFYQSWLAQAQVHAARENADRKKRLLELTRLQARRGTSERPDVIQVNEALLASEIQWRDAVDSLEDMWRSLVLSLKLPAHWMSLDPMQVPLQLDHPIASAQTKCKKGMSFGNAEQVNDQILRLQLQKQASFSQVEAAKDELNPQLEFSVGLLANGIDDSDRGSTLSEAFSAKTPAWTVGLSLKMAVERYQQRANLYRKAAQYARVAAEEAQARSNFEVEWANACNRLGSWDLKVARLKKSLEAQKLRNTLEERRFRLGRGVLNNVILAGDDATATETRLNVAQIEIRKTAWDVLRRSGEGKNYLEGIQEEIQKLLREKAKR